MELIYFIIILVVVAGAIIYSNFNKIKHVEELKEKREDKKRQWQEEANKAMIGEMEQIRTHLIEAIESHFGSDEEQAKKLVSIINEVLKDEKNIWAERRSWIRSPKDAKK